MLNILKKKKTLELKHREASLKFFVRILATTVLLTKILPTVGIN